jgi:excinuclease UvrABC nuclease subunit
MVLPDVLQESLDNLPPEPGVYRLKDHQQRILYVGKSKNLRDRVRTYFHSPSDRKSAHLRARTKALDFLVLESDQQAQEVEWDLIRSHGPDYNTIFLDYWNRPYIKLTVNEPYPRIALTQRRDDPDAEYYGPYKNTRRLRETLVALRDTFPIRDCDLSIPEGGDAQRYESCMEYELGRCSAPCVGRESVQTYRDRLQPIRSFLEGNYSRVLALLEDRMKDSSEKRHYEAAAIYRDRLEAVRNMVNYQPFLRETLRCDVWGRHQSTLVFLRIREHRVVDFGVYENVDSIPQRINRYYDHNPNPGHDILLDQSIKSGAVATGRRPEGDEECRLVETAQRTADARQSISLNPENPVDVVDRVTLTDGTVSIRRELTESSHIRKKTVRDSYSGLNHTLMTMYRDDFESGRILPTEVRLEADHQINAADAPMFSDSDFWFPLLHK